MDRLVDDLAAQHRELDSLVAGLDEHGLGRPTRCEGWDVSDVLIHLAQTDEMASASLDGRFDQYLTTMTAGLGSAASVDEGAALMVARERVAGPMAALERWRVASGAVVEGLRRCDPRRRVVWVAGELSARTLAATRLSEAWIHAGDIADGLGERLDPTPRLEHVARLAWRTLPYAFARGGESLAGPVSFVLDAPGGGTWRFLPDEPPVTTIVGDGVELCEVAARRRGATRTGLSGEGPDVDRVLALVRTYA